MSVRITFAVVGVSLAPFHLADAAPSRTVHLEAFFQQQFVEVACPTGTPEDRFCLRATGEGLVAGIGRAKFSRLVIIGGDFADGCVPASTSGTLTARSSGDTLSFAGSGSYCVVAGTAAYAFTLSGGTGGLAGLTGNGTITVPPATTVSTGTEIWTGLAAH